MWEAIEKLGLEIHIGPMRDIWAGSILWDKPKINQVMAHDSRAMIVYAEGSSPLEVLDELEIKLKAWIENHKEVIK